MDLTRLAVDAGQFINRAVQYTGEALGTSEKTELEPDLEQLLAKADATKTHTDQIISQTEALLQPSAAARLEERLYEHLEWRPPPRPRCLEVLGDIMTSAGLELGSITPYGSALVKCGETQKQLGEAEKKFAQSTNIHFLLPLKSFTEGEYKAIQEERRALTNKRLDLDIAKTRLRKAHEADREARNLNSNPLEEDYLAHVSYMFSFIRVKWLKVWAQEISQAEMELGMFQCLFDRQAEISKRLLSGLEDTHMNHMQSLNEFVEAQTCYFDECNQLAQELNKQLESIPAVLCSNNWQSTITNGVSQTSTDNASVELSGSNRGNPIVLHRIPDFDQDSWTLESKIEKTPHTRTDLQSQSNTNFNNNNRTLIEIQSTAHCPASNSQSPANEAFNINNASVSKPRKHVSPLQRTDTMTVNDELSCDSEVTLEDNGTALKDKPMSSTVSHKPSKDSDKDNGTTQKDEPISSIASGKPSKDSEVTVEEDTKALKDEPVSSTVSNKLSKGSEVTVEDNTKALKDEPVSSTVSYKPSKDSEVTVEDSGTTQIDKPMSSTVKDKPNSNSEVIGEDSGESLKDKPWSSTGSDKPSGHSQVEHHDASLNDNVVEMKNNTETNLTNTDVNEDTATTPTNEEEEVKDS